MRQARKKDVVKKGTAIVKRVKPKLDTAYDDTPLKERTYIYKVEAGVILSGVRSGSTEIKFPFALMNTGDSFLLPSKDEATKNPNMLHYAAKQYARFKPGFTITSRLQLDGSRRVWRLK